MPERYMEGARIEWKWGSGSKADPAYYIETSNESNVLKLHSELEKQ